MKKKIAVLACGWSSAFLKDFILGMKKAVDGKNIDIYLFNTYNFIEHSGFPNFTGASIFNIVHYEDFDGVIILADLIGNPRIIEKERLKIIKAGKPALSINKKVEGIGCLKVDNYSGMYDSISHLIKMHNVTDLAFISGKEQTIDISERYKAYMAALKDNNIAFNAEKVFTLEHSNYNDAYNFFTDYVKSGKKLPQALVCSNDLIALATLKACYENKIPVPQTLKIIGFDNIPETACIYPSITTVHSNAKQLGAEAVSRLEFGINPSHILKMQTLPIFRQSCGCQNSSPDQNKQIALSVIDASYSKEDFDKQIEVISEIFTEAADVFTLLTNVENFLTKSHTFEGTDFCIFMKSDWTSVLINSAENLPQDISYGKQVQSICSVQNNKKYLREMINTRDLIPEKMKSEGCNTYLFLPIYHHSYVHGYFVTKNNLSLVENNYGYVWTRVFGTSIEHFRKKNMYKQMSQEYLKISTKDALSGMLNRQGLDRIAKPYYSQNKKNGLTTVLFFVDINKMKHINDQFGHLHGDLAVKTVAAAVLETVPRNWLCIRYGGDEFLVVGNSKNYNGEDYCSLIKQKLLSKVSVMKLPYTLSASVGTYSVPANSNLTLEQAVENVDSIMYEQKQAFHKENDKA